jgi:hypothetical protein
MKKKQQADKMKTKAKQEVIPQERGSDAVRQAQDRLRRELFEIRDSLTALQANTEVNERARAAAVDVIKAITVMLQQHPIDYGFGDILQSDCLWCETDLVGELEILDEELGERLGVWQWVSAFGSGRGCTNTTTSSTIRTSTSSG